MATSAYYQRNREAILEKERARRLADPEKNKQRKKADLEKHREKRRKKQEEWKELNAERHSERRKQYFQENKDIIYQKRKTQPWEEKRSAYNAAYREKNKESIAKLSRGWVLNNMDRVRVAKRRHAESSVQYQIAKKLRSRIRCVVKRVGGVKSEKTMSLIGCTVADLMLHLESLFAEGMTWENHGRNGWHIDHKIPCIAFDLTKEDEQLKCFHYTNLQPLWWHENLSKGKKIL